MSYLRLLGLYIKISALNELQYRVNFFVQLFQSALALGTGLVSLSLVFTYTATLGGWNRSELLIVMGVHILVGGLIKTLIQPNMERLMEDVQQGTLDYALTKPADSQVLVSVREFRVWQTIDIVMGAIVMAAGVWQLRASVGVLDALAFGAAILLGGLMIYSVWLMLTTGSFWIVRVDNILEIFQSFYQAGRWPVGIYPGWLRSSLTFIVPVAFAVTVPAEALTNRLTGTVLLAMAGLAALLFVLARLLWRFGLRNYGGASA
ncbi:MAG TPA: ABC-2 family transporter protein [Herpetosiphonaceae bacterium]|nr:ABC-2 family transporter protein [Herpetosiphonaceae bacterium]